MYVRRPRPPSPRPRAVVDGRPVGRQKTKKATRSPGSPSRKSLARSSREVLAGPARSSAGCFTDLRASVGGRPFLVPRVTVRVRMPTLRRWGLSRDPRRGGWWGRYPQPASIDSIRCTLPRTFRVPTLRALPRLEEPIPESLRPLMSLVAPRARPNRLHAPVGRFPSRAELLFRGATREGVDPLDQIRRPTFRLESADLHEPRHLPP
jgi:hypothetical protein